MNVFGIVVEGPRDAVVYATIIRRIRSDVHVIPRPCGGITALLDRFAGWLKYFQYQQQQIDKVLVIRDAGGKDPQALERDLAERLEKSHCDPPFPVHFYAIKSMLETWLLADEHAVSKVAESRRRHGKVKATNKQLEGLLDPKPSFLAMLSQVDLPANDKVYEEVAAAADLDRIAERCPRFAEFREQVHAC